jgi:hypothetical protein
MNSICHVKMMFMTQGNKIIKSKNICVLTIVLAPTSSIFCEITKCRLCPNLGYQKNMLINAKKKKFLQV